jgi:hypothetical protein
MKTGIKIAILIGFTSLYSMANPAFMGGITFKFGGNYSMENAGATFKVVSNDKDKKPVVTAGVSYYPWSKGTKYGVDVGAGYNVKNTTISGGWDFVQNQPNVSVGVSTALSGGYEEFKEDPTKQTSSCSASK